MLNQSIQRTAVRIAVLLFFVMAVVGWLSGLEPATCASRALMGAVVVFFTVRLAGKLVIRVLVGALVEDQVRRRQQQGKKGS